MSRRAVIGLVVGSLCACGDPPSLPSGASSAPPPGAALGVSGFPSALGSQTISGRVVHALDGRGLEGARVSIPEGASATTGSDGTFTLAAPVGAPVPLVVSGEGFHPRETRFQPASVRAVEIDLLPDGAGFDLDFFDHIFRNLGRDGTERWTVIPDFEIWTRIYECREGEIHDCDELIATEDEAPGQFLKIARDTIVADAPKYTGGKIQSFQITTRTHLPGEHLTLRDYFIPGKTTIVFIKKHDASFAWLWPYESGALYSVTIQILNKHRADAAVYSHELAHAMGFSHPAGYENVPLPSIMRTAERVTRQDELHGSILYRRPPGSRTADRDPDDFIVNALRSLESGPPPLTSLRIVRD